MKSNGALIETSQPYSRNRTGVSVHLLGAINGQVSPPWPPSDTDQAEPRFSFNRWENYVVSPTAKTTVRKLWAARTRSLHHDTMKNVCPRVAAAAISCLRRRISNVLNKALEGYEIMYECL